MGEHQPREPGGWHSIPPRIADASINLSGRLSAYIYLQYIRLPLRAQLVSSCIGQAPHTMKIIFQEYHSLTMSAVDTAALLLVSRYFVLEAVVAANGLHGGRY